MRRHLFCLHVVGVICNMWLQFLPSKSYSAAMFFQLGNSVCLPHFPTRNYDFRLHGDVISHWETRKYHFPRPKKRGKWARPVFNSRCYLYELLMSGRPSSQIACSCAHLCAFQSLELGEYTTLCSDIMFASVSFCEFGPYLHQNFQLIIIIIMIIIIIIY